MNTGEKPGDGAPASGCWKKGCGIGCLIYLLLKTAASCADRAEKREKIRLERAARVQMLKDDAAGREQQARQKAQIPRPATKKPTGTRREANIPLRYRYEIPRDRSYHLEVCSGLAGENPQRLELGKY